MSETLSQSAAASTFARLSGPIVSDVRQGVRAASLGGRRRIEVVMEALALAGGPGRLSLAEYFYYRLWDSPLPLSEKLRYAGKGVQKPMHLCCNDVTWSAVTEDKLLFQAVATGAGLPVPQILGIAHPTRSLTGVPSATDGDQLRAMLANPSLYPCFAKPIAGRYSIGAVGLEGLDGTVSMKLSNGETASLAEVVAHLGLPCGYIIQERLRSDAQIAALFGDRLWSARVVVLLGPTGPKLIRAVCKVPAPGSMADNFWRAGNMLAAVDMSTGRLIRAVRGTGDAMEVDFDHPETGSPIVGSSVPRWPELLDLVAEASSLLPGVRTQSWDVALTDRGPVLLEVNFAGDLNLVQLAYGLGIMDDAFVHHLQARGYGDPRFTKWAPRSVTGSSHTAAA